MLLSRGASNGHTQCNCNPQTQHKQCDCFSFHGNRLLSLFDRLSSTGLRSPKQILHLLYKALTRLTPDPPGERGPPAEATFSSSRPGPTCRQCPVKELEHFGFATSVRSEYRQEAGSLGNSRACGCSKVPTNKRWSSQREETPSREIHTVQCLGFVRSVW